MAVFAAPSQWARVTPPPIDRRTTMAESRSRTRRNTLERRCLPKTYKRMFVGASKGIFKMLEKIKKA